MKTPSTELSDLRIPSPRHRNNMNIKEFADRALFALSVPKCVCCRKRLSYGEKAFCPECSAKYEDFKHRNCHKCSHSLPFCSCSNEHLSTHYIKKTLKCFRYLHRDESCPQNSLIYSLKRDNRSDVLNFCVDELASVIRNHIDNPQEYIFINVPRRAAAINEYGIDHSALLAIELAKRFGANYYNLLKSNSKKPQKALEKIERLKNTDFEIVNEIDLTGKSVIIVDDIITSGASMGTAASLLRSLGCKNIVALTLGIAYKE